MEITIEDRQLDRLFHALADATRRKILRLVAMDRLRVTEIAGNFDISLNAVSKHLKVLENAGLLDRRQDGRSYYLQTNANPLRAAEDFLIFYESFWEERLNRLDEILTHTNSRND